MEGNGKENQVYLDDVDSYFDQNKTVKTLKRSTVKGIQYLFIKIRIRTYTNNV